MRFAHNQTRCAFPICSHDVINRWVYPLVPDMGICCLEQNYMFRRNNVYRNRSVQLANTAALRENVVIHEGCTVGERTWLVNAVVGRNCKIGQNCVLENAFVFDGVEIGDKCELRNCVIGRMSKISSESIIQDGTIIGHCCELPRGKKLEKSFIVAKPQNSDFDEGKRKQSNATFMQQISLVPTFLQLRTRKSATMHILCK